MRDQEQKKKVKKPREEEWIPTQEELLEEAKITEEENLASLGMFVGFVSVDYLHFFSFRKISKDGE